MENEVLWENVLSELELHVSRPNFLTWLKNSRFIGLKEDNHKALVALPNHFAKEWVETKYHKLILGSIRNINNSVNKIEYVVESNLIKKGLAPVTITKIIQETKQLSFQEMRVDPETNLNQRYTLNSFIVGASNELAYSAATAIVQSVGNKYNPLFIYGGVGLGKTHLIQAVGNEIKEKYKNGVKVKYVTSEKFTNDVVWAIRNRRMEDVKNMYRYTDVLIIDDIQFIGGKEKTEEEFFHTFNALSENNKQIIISSDRPPRSIPTLEERLRSRFEGGRIDDINLPDYATRVAIIKTKLQEKLAVLEEEIIDLIAKKVQKNIREIEGILNKIIFHQTTYQKNLEANLVDKIISEMTDRRTANLNPNQVINTVANFFEISTSDITGKARNKELIEPRQITVYLLRELLSMSYPYIADKIGKRDHTTAIYSYNKIVGDINKNPNLNQKILLIKDELNKLG